MRGLLSEFGIVLNQGIANVRKRLPGILEDGENQLHPLFRNALALKYQQLCELDQLVKDLTSVIETDAKQHAEIKRLQSIPGFGGIVSSAYFSVIGDGRAFGNGRDAS